VSAERTLTRRELNRALLARQLLLEPSALPVADAIERIAGIQAQAIGAPFMALRVRLQTFDEHQLRALVESRDVVRAPLMRHTLHMVTAADYLRFRGPVQRALERAYSGTRKRVEDAHLETALPVAHEIFAAGPATFADVKRRLRELIPGFYEPGVTYGIRTYIPLICAPTGGRWMFSGKAPFVLAEDWLGEPVPMEPGASELIRRYLAAFGPASVADAQAWSGIPGLKAEFEALRPQLSTFRDERGRELFDVPDGVLPAGETPVHVRFTAEFDNALLGYQDRSRIVADEHKPRVFKETKNGRIPGTFLVDGFVAGRWWIELEKANATLVLEPFRKLTNTERADVAAGAEALLDHAEPDAAGRALRFAAPA
jgi:DNA glycosylase AlkZ-like